MKQRLVLPFTLAAVAASTLVVGAGAASANTGDIHTTSCRTRTDFFKVWYDGGKKTVCYASDGGAPVSYQNVTKVTTGNNSGTIEVYSGGNGGYLAFPHFATVTMKPSTELYYITITGR